MGLFFCCLELIISHWFNEAQKMFQILTFLEKLIVSFTMRRLACITITCCFVTIATFAQLKIAKLKYNGGGDWYANKTALPNLISFCNKELGTHLEAEEDVVEVNSPALFDYAYIY
ncbi:MAG: DUF4159 domain-containing protein, partial [Cyclobacteriaceae bacterium]